MGCGIARLRRSSSSPLPCRVAQVSAEPRTISAARALRRSGPRRRVHYAREPGRSRSPRYRLCSPIPPRFLSRHSLSIIHSHSNSNRTTHPPAHLVPYTQASLLPLNEPPTNPHPPLIQRPQRLKRRDAQIDTVRSAPGTEVGDFGGDGVGPDGQGDGAATGGAGGVLWFQVSECVKEGRGTRERGTYGAGGEGDDQVAVRVLASTRAKRSSLVVVRRTTTGVLGRFDGGGAGGGGGGGARGGSRG